MLYGCQWRPHVILMLCTFVLWDVVGSDRCPHPLISDLDGCTHPLISDLDGCPHPPISDLDGCPHPPIWDLDGCPDPPIWDLDGCPHPPQCLGSGWVPRMGTQIRPAYNVSFGVSLINGHNRRTFEHRHETKKVFLICFNKISHTLSSLGQLFMSQCTMFHFALH